MIEFIIIVFFCFILPVVVLVKPIREAAKRERIGKEWLIEYKEELILYFVLAFGSFIRIFLIDKMPNALNVDEASSGYDAYSLLHFGVDRGGNSFPVYLYAWGSGQSVLYTYVSIPFVAIMGLTEYSIRLPMALAGIVSLYVFYYLIKTLFDNKKMALLALIFFAICPWHIMKSRWGMECNLFPELVLWAVLLLVLGLKRDKIILQILAFIVLGISCYSYATSYLFLFVFIIVVLIFLLIAKRITIKRAILFLGIIGIICMPILLFNIVNKMDLDQIQIGKITIPKMKENRANYIIPKFDSNLYENCVDNILDLERIIYLQIDDLEWNSIKPYGLFYRVSIIFLILGLVYSFTKYKDNYLSNIMNIWFFAAIVLGAFCKININRMNIIIIPCVYYSAIGIYEIFTKYKTMILSISLVYIYLFINFGLTYIKEDYNEYYTFTSGIKEVAQYCENSDCNKVYCQYSFKEPFIYFMFYTESDVNEYLDTVQYFSEDHIFDNIKSYGKYNFYLPDEVEENTIVIVTKDTELVYDRSFNKTTVNQFDIYEF